MKTLRKMNGNKYLFYLLVAGIFGIMFLLNHYTFYAADDYSYMNSFATHKKIQTVWDIFPSMYAHAKGMNGRLVAHFFVQLFLLLPSGIFDVVNAVLFTMLILILYRYLFWNKKRNALALVSIFGLVWYFAPAFGQTMLWLDGSCNYLWGCTFSLYYLYPFMKLAKNEKVMEGKIQKILFLVAGFAMGDYLETASFGTIVLAVLLLAYHRWMKKEKIPVWGMGSVLTMLAGFLFMMTAPGTLKNKVATSGLHGYVDNFINAMDLYVEHLLILLLILIVLIVCSVILEWYKKTWIALFFLAASLITNFMHTVASYYPERNMLSSALFLIVGILIMVEEFWHRKIGIAVTCSCWILLVFFTVQFFHGSWDIYNTYAKCMARDRLAKEQIAAGEKNLTLPVVIPETEYAALKGLADLDAADRYAWNNAAMAAYYQVESIIGVAE